MCLSKKPKKPHQPWRSDPDVARHYTPPANNKWGSKGDEYAAWEDAKYKYEKEQAHRVQGEQRAMQERFLAQEEAFQKKQMELQKRLHEQQQQYQKDMEAKRLEMEQRQMEYERSMDQQRTIYEKNAAQSQKEMQRQMEQQAKKSKAQQRFKAGRGDNVKSRTGITGGGTASLQIGVGGTSKKGESGLQIPK